MKIQFLGQNCFLITYKGKNILTDPFYNIQKDKSGFNISAQNIDFVLITHAHEDHIADVEEVLAHHPNAEILSTPEICKFYKNHKSTDYNIGGYVKVEDMKITMVRADHTSSFPDGSYGGVPVGYIFRFDGKCVYLSGDTGVFSEMELFPKIYGEITAAILCVGAHYTMCARQAAFSASNLLKTNKVIGCHFDTFPPIKIDHDWAREQFKNVKVEFTLPEIGEIFEI